MGGFWRVVLLKINKKKQGLCKLRVVFIAFLQRCDSDVFCFELIVLTKPVKEN